MRCCRSLAPRVAISNVVTYSRSMFPARYFRHLHGVEWLREQYRTYLRRRPRRQLMPEFFRHQTTDVRVFLDIDSFQRDSGFRPDVVTIGAIYTHRMEFGPRALGTRAILANPARRETHDLLITRLEGSEFMPFATVIQSEKAAQIFDVKNVNRRACRYMTIACDVRPEWRDRVPAVVHVDHSARPRRQSALPRHPQTRDRVAGTGEHQFQRARRADRQHAGRMHQGAARWPHRFCGNGPGDLGAGALETRRLLAEKSVKIAAFVSRLGVL